MKKLYLRCGAALLAAATAHAAAALPALPDYGPAPRLAGIARWLNSPPLDLEALRGKVVLVDFWTYACVNCARAVPHVVRWHTKYKDQGLVVIGVHTPEFGFERNAASVQKAIGRYAIGYPVALDNQYATWRAFDNQYWPALYLIDKRGHVRYRHAGEGNYDLTASAIEQLLAAP